MPSIHADKLSRDNNSSDLRLRPDVFQVLNASRGLLQVDRLDTAANAQLQQFNSRMASPGAVLVNARLQPWGGCLNYLSPPLSQIDLVVPQMKQDCALAVSLVPHWRAFQWWQPLLMASKAAKYLLSCARLLSDGRWATLASPPSW